MNPKYFIATNENEIIKLGKKCILLPYNNIHYHYRQ